MRLFIEVAHLKKQIYMRKKVLLRKKAGMPVKITRRPVVRVLLKACYQRFSKSDPASSIIAAEKQNKIFLKEIQSALRQ
ncbi:hypothetical protein OJE16_14265 [Pantoea tagorei]